MHNVKRHIKVGLLVQTGYRSSLLKYSTLYVFQEDIIAQLTPKIGSLLQQGDSGLIERNLLQVQVFYEEFNYEAVTEAPAYPVSIHLARIGPLVRV